MQWEEGKRLQRRIETLKTKLEERGKQIDRLESELKHAHAAAEQLREEKKLLLGDNKKLLAKIQQQQRREEEAPADTVKAKGAPAPASAAAAAAREKELQDTVLTLRKALERCQADLKSSVPSSKFLQAARKRDELQQQVAALQQQLASASQPAVGQLSSLEDKARELQATNAALRRQIKTLTELTASQADRARRVDELEAQVQALGMQVKERELLMGALRSAIAEKDQQLATGVAPASSPALQARISALEAENAGLRREIEAFNEFGPEFFEELEDLKYAYHSLKQQHADLVNKYQALEGATRR